MLKLFNFSPRNTDMNGNDNDDIQNVEQPPNNNYEVDIYGHPGAGKTLLLVALYKIFPQPDGTRIEISAELGNRYRGLVNNEFPGRTQWDSDTDESLTFQLQARTKLPPIQMRITAHAGEEHTKREPKEIKQEFQNKRREKLLVVVVNPFLHNPELAWKAFRNLVAVLQNRLELSIKEACYAAADILFHVSTETLIPEPLRTEVEALFSRLEAAQLKYNHDEPNMEQQFTLTNVEEQVQFNELIGPIVTGIVEKRRPDRDRLRNLMAGLDNSLLVLSHVDMMDLLPSIRADDFDDVFNSIFNTPNRNYRRQLLAHNIRLAIRAQLERAQEGQPGYYVYPAAVLEKSAQQFYQNIKSFAIEAKTGQPGYDEYVKLVDEHLVNTDKNLVTAVENLHEDLTQLNQKLANDNPENTENTLITAVENLHKDFIQLNQQVANNTRGNTEKTLITAVENLHKDFIQLNQQVADNARGNTAKTLVTAVENLHKDLIQLNQQVADNTRGNTAKTLVTAVENIHQDLTLLNQKFARLETSFTIAKALNELSQLNNSLKSLSKLKLPNIGSLSSSIIFLAIIQGIFAFLVLLAILKS
jgi:type VI protein secretion system component VasF